jgi:hypothetical protein
MERLASYDACAMSAYRIIFVPGMKPKPPPDVHQQQLCRVIAAGLSRVRPALASEFSGRSGCLSLISWTYSFYRCHADISLDLPGIDALLRQPEPTESDISEIDSIARKLARLVHVLGDAAPWFRRLVAKPEVRLTLGEARRYLLNRGGRATTIRAMLKQVLRQAWQDGERVLLIGHSLGSVIAYDTLWELSRSEPVGLKVDLFMTLGSPLGSRFINRRICGAAYPLEERYPSNIRQWANFSARAEMTSLHPELLPFFREMLDLGLLESLTDEVDLYNYFRGDLGLNVHKSYGYLVDRKVAERIAIWLES